jgi:adenylate cyclase
VFRTRRRKRLLVHTLILLVVGCVLALIALGGSFSGLRMFFADRLYASESMPPNVVIVAIDNQTLEDLHTRISGELPRSYHAQVIEALSQAKASVIAFDLLFDQTTAEDSAMVQAMQQAGNVVLPVAGYQGADGSVLVYQEFVTPPADLYQAAAMIGHVNTPPDNDGRVRRIPLVVKDSVGGSYPSLTLAALDVHFPNPAWSLPEEYVVQDGKLGLFGRDIPVNGAKCMMVNYVGGPGSVTTLSYKDVLGGNFDTELVKNKIVLIGVTATAETDFWSTPASSAKLPGVEIHANAIDTILRQRFLIETSNGLSSVIILVMTAVLALSLPRMKLRWGALLTVGIMVVYLALAIAIAFERGYIMDLLHPPVAVLVIYVAGIICSVTAEQQRRREVRDLFGKYVSPEVADQIEELSDTGGLKLGGEQREVTVLFADLRGFTSLSEQRSPEAVVDLLNKYFSTIIDCILSNSGIVNKFGGDNILALWNAPQAQEDHAFHAVKAAVEAQQAIERMQQEDPELHPAQFGIGINTGEVLAGNVGSVGRLEYTAIGDAVNLAARLCGSAPGGHVWVSSQTYVRILDRVEAKELELQYFKGKKEAVVVYQILGLRSS